MPVIAQDHLCADSVASFANQFAITPSDTDELPNVTRAIFIGVGGTISCVAVNDGSNPVSWNVPSGFILPGRIRKVLANGTSATNIIGLY